MQSMCSGRIWFIANMKYPQKIRIKMIAWKKSGFGGLSS